MVLDLA